LTLELHCPKLPKRSWVKITQIRTISQERIGDYLGKIDNTQINEIVAAIGDLIEQD
jgi:mRNA interferase MazF